MRAHLVRRLGAVGGPHPCSLVATVVPATMAGSAPPPGGWAPAATATIHPGVQMFTDGAQCTANFIFTNGHRRPDRLRRALRRPRRRHGHRRLPAPTLPLGTPVEITGASQPGTLVYSSWLAMQASGETNADTCAYNDLALVQIAAADVGKVNPSIPHWGGPTGLNTTGNPRCPACTRYGNSSLRLGHHAAVTQDGREPRHHGRRLDAPVLHRHARHPGRLRLRHARRAGTRQRRPLHPRLAPAAAAATTSATSTASWPTPAAMARAASPSRTAPSPSTAASSRSASSPQRQRTRSAAAHRSADGTGRDRSSRCGSVRRARRAVA